MESSQPRSIGDGLLAQNGRQDGFEASHVGAGVARVDVEVERLSCLYRLCVSIRSFFLLLVKYSSSSFTYIDLCNGLEPLGIVGIPKGGAGVQAGRNGRMAVDASISMHRLGGERQRRNVGHVFV